MYPSTGDEHSTPKTDTWIRAFQTGRIPPEQFRHRDHAHIAWAYLSRWSFPEALGRFSHDLEHFATAHGRPDLYHATVTTAYLALIAERMAAGKDDCWDAFAAANPDLLRWKDGALFEYYDLSILDSAFAREVFVLPRPIGGGALGVNQM